MKNGALVLLIFLSFMSKANASSNHPLWMESQLIAIQKPTNLSESEQESCTLSLLNEVNHHLKTSFTEHDLAPIQMPGWDQPEMGFMRGGGFNIRIVTSVNRGTEGDHIHSGRFADLETALKLGAGASLHIPEKIEGLTTFLKSESDDGEQIQYDFIAHSDTGYAYLPLGVFIHVFRDVLGADGRRPCPAERE